MGTVVLPAIIVAAVGLIAGIILTIAAKLMFVPVDERVAAIEEVLPGANCGACGYSGCSGYAKALCTGSAENGLCAPGGPEVVQKISELIGGGAVTLVPKVAMVHCNNCTSDLNAWVGLFKECLEAFGAKVDMDTLYGTLYNKALEGDKDCGGLLAYNYFSGEHITGFEEGRPLFVRTPDSKFDLANFMRVHLSTSLGALKTGMDILTKQEHVELDKMLGHGGLFKTKGVGQKILAGAIDTPVYVMETAGEGGAWGIALLASYMKNKKAEESLTDYLAAHVFGGEEGARMEPDPADAAGFEKFMQLYKAGLAIERAAVDMM